MDIDKSYQTKLIHYKEGGNGSVVPPIYQSSLFTFENWDSIDKAFDDPFNNSIYTRGNNPSVSLVEEKNCYFMWRRKGKAIFIWYGSYIFRHIALCKKWRTYNFHKKCIWSR